MMGNNIIHKLNNDDFNIDEVVELLNHSSLMISANAILALIRRREEVINSALDNTVVEQLVTIASDSKNNHAQIIGSLTLSYLAIGCLFKLGTFKAKSAGGKLADQLEQSEREKIKWFFKDINFQDT